MLARNSKWMGPFTGRSTRTDHHHSLHTLSCWALTCIVATLAPDLTAVFCLKPSDSGIYLNAHLRHWTSINHILSAILIAMVSFRQAEKGLLAERYCRYKANTKHVLVEICGDNSSRRSCRQILRDAEIYAKRRNLLPRKTQQYLADAIEGRLKVIETFERTTEPIGTGLAQANQNHLHFVEVLQSIQSLLAPSATKTGEDSRNPETPNATHQNRYQTLMSNVDATEAEIEDAGHEHISKELRHSALPDYVLESKPDELDFLSFIVPCLTGISEWLAEMELKCVSFRNGHIDYIVLSCCRWFLGCLTWVLTSPVASIAYKEIKSSISNVLSMTEKWDDPVSVFTPALLAEFGLSGNYMLFNVLECFHDRTTITGLGHSRQYELNAEVPAIIEEIEEPWLFKKLEHNGNSSIPFQSMLAGVIHDNSTRRAVFAGMTHCKLQMGSIGTTPTITGLEVPEQHIMIERMHLAGMLW